MKPLVVAGLAVLVACRPLGPGPRTEPAAETPSPDRPPASGDPAEVQMVAAITDSIRASLRDSLAAVARRDSIAAVARRDSIDAAARDSIAAAARRDSIAAAARADSILAAARDSIAAAARRDSIAGAARADSIAAAAREAARQDSIREAARQDSLASEQARRDSIAAAIGAAMRDSLAARSRTFSADVEELRALGPAYIPYDRGPEPVWDTETQAMLTTTLLPVVRAEELTARTRAYYWLLIDSEGRVADFVLQTSSGSEAFDRAAAEAVRQIRFTPALRGGRPVATWVVRDVSLIMQ